MSFLDALLGAALPGGNKSASLGTTLLQTLAAESGGGSNPDAAAQMPDNGNAARPLSSGLAELAQRLEQGGLGDAVRSWIGSGNNQPVDPDALHRAIGPQTIERMADQTGISRDELLPLLAKALPAIVDRLTPNQRLPQEGELAQLQPDRPVEV